METDEQAETETQRQREAKAEEDRQTDSHTYRQTKRQTEKSPWGVSKTLAPSRKRLSPPSHSAALHENCGKCTQ